MTAPMERVLVVEDDPDLRRLFQRILEEAGYRVRAVTRTAEAVGEIRKGAFDAALVDCRLRAGADGVDVARRIVEARLGIGVVMMSGDGEHLMRARAAGFRRLLMKPFTAKELLAALATA